MEDSVAIVEILDQAVQVAREKGYKADGWFFQRDAAGFTVWLYWEDEEDEGVVFDDIEVVPTPMAAATYCLSRAAALLPLIPTDETEN